MSSQSKAPVVLCAAFDTMRAPDIRLLEEAGKLGAVQVCLWDDTTVEALTGTPPKFPQAERLYYVQAIRYVSDVSLVSGLDSANQLPKGLDTQGKIWVVGQHEDTAEKQAYCQANGMSYQVIGSEVLATLPAYDPSVILTSGASHRSSVLVTGCYDWFHTGHVRFFEECSELGDLYVVVGHDANLEKLKGPGHPMFKENERRYIAGSIRYVTQALISTGDGWLDAEPEIKRIKPDQYAVNEDGDKPVKQQFCQANGIAYVVLKRLPKPGLTRRESTHLRGF